MLRPEPEQNACGTGCKAQSGYRCHDESRQRQEVVGKERRRGKVVAVSGVYGLKGLAQHMAGCTSKWAVEGLVRVLALEAGPFNINVNAVCPGYVEGPRSHAGMASRAAARGIDAARVRDELEQAAALRRLSTAEDVANAVLFLASERARNITGRDLVVDGGWML